MATREGKLGAGRSDDGPGVPDSAYWISRLGAMIKERRSGRFTVEELAARAGVSAGLISQIERGIGNPSFSTLSRLANALGLPIVAMFEGPEFDERQMIVRRKDRRRLVVPDEGTVHEILVPSSNRRLGMLSSVLPPGYEADEVGNTHPGEEIVLVVSGTLHAYIGGQAFVLEAGDTATYDSSLPHRWSNPGAKPVELLAISTPPATDLTH
ncbi:MAG TPA: XRE family transcriptional regulator [Solirubrobacter sp.]|nr:XRE family transcriptional regulator [Solirubrobacter sp.]